MTASPSSLRYIPPPIPPLHQVLHTCAMWVHAPIRSTRPLAVLCTETTFGACFEKQNTCSVYILQTKDARRRLSSTAPTASPRYFAGLRPLTICTLLACPTACTRMSDSLSAGRNKSDPGNHPPRRGWSGMPVSTSPVIPGLSTMGRTDASREANGVVGLPDDCSLAVDTKQILGTTAAARYTTGQIGCFSSLGSVCIDGGGWAPGGTSPTTRPQPGLPSSYLHALHTPTIGPCTFSTLQCPFQAPAG